MGMSVCLCVWWRLVVDVGMSGDWGVRTRLSAVTDGICSKVPASLIPANKL
jgi:hypothetical protein